MICLSCGISCPEDSRGCPSCNSFYLISLNGCKPELNFELREKLLECCLNFASPADITGWLRNLGQDTKGSLEEKRIRVWQHTKYLSLPSAIFLFETLRDLMRFRADELAEICIALRLNDNGTKTDLIRRIYREACYRERLVATLDRANLSFEKESLLPFIQLHPILKNHQYEKDYYDDFYSDMSEVFGVQHVHSQLAVAHGAGLKIDFHIGHPQTGGVGIEFKMPTCNSEVQRALGQMDQYMNRYQSELVVVLLPDFLSSAARELFIDELKRKGITTVVKEKIQ